MPSMTPQVATCSRPATHARSPPRRGSMNVSFTMRLSPRWARLSRGRAPVRVMRPPSVGGHDILASPGRTRSPTGRYQIRTRSSQVGRGGRKDGIRRRFDPSIVRNHAPDAVRIPIEPPCARWRYRWRNMDQNTSARDGPRGLRQAWAMGFEGNWRSSRCRRRRQEQTKSPAMVSPHHVAGEGSGRKQLGELL